MSDAFLWVGGAALIVGLGALFVFAAVAEHRECEAKGGKIVSKSTTGFGVSGNGQMVTTFGSVSFCVSSDGRILQ